MRAATSGEGPVSFRPVPLRRAPSGSGRAPGAGDGGGGAGRPAPPGPRAALPLPLSSTEGLPAPPAPFCQPPSPPAHNSRDPLGQALRVRVSPPRKGGPVRAPAVSEQGPWYPAPLLLPSASFHTRWGRAGFPQPARRQDQPQGSVPSLPSRGVSQGCQAVVNRPRVLHPAPVGVAEVNPASPASFCGKGLPRPSRLR